MNTAKDIVVKPISSTDANALMKRLHYSKKIVNNSQLHLGVFLTGRCEGVMQFGPPMKKQHVLTLVKDTPWNGMLELNRMAFSDRLPRNSESRALGVAFRMIKANYPHIQWILSFSDATQCGDGIIYRASGFVLTSIKKNTGILRLKDGTIGTLMTYGKGKHILSKDGGAKKPEGSVCLPGYQLRYIYFLHKDAKARLTVPTIPFNKIKEVGASMYKGVKRGGSKDNVAAGFQLAEDGATPIPPLQNALGITAGE